MTTADAPAHPAFRTPRVIYLMFCALLLVGLLAQVFMAGLGVLVDPGYFALHKSFGHAFGPVTLASHRGSLIDRRR